MYKYVEIYGGKVRDLKTSHLKYTEFCSIFDPSCYWIDVTNVDDVAIGDIVKFSTDVGTYFEKPKPIEVTLESVRNAKLEMLDYMFKLQLEKAAILSSLGVYMNAGTRAKNDVDGLLQQMETEGLTTKEFMSYDDIKVPVTYEELKTLQLEIIKNGHSIYNQKWAYRDAIKAATSIEELNSITIQFFMYDFINDRLMD